MYTLTALATLLSSIRERQTWLRLAPETRDRQQQQSVFLEAS